jgi:hypothetical protein
MFSFRWAKLCLNAGSHDPQSSLFSLLLVRTSRELRLFVKSTNVKFKRDID